jgi:hypothetical protein
MGFFLEYNFLSTWCFYEIPSKPMAMVSYVVDYYLKEMLKKCSKSNEKYVCHNTFVMGIAIAKIFSSTTWF